MSCYGHCFRREHIEARQPIVYVIYPPNDCGRHLPIPVMLRRRRDRLPATREAYDVRRELRARSPVVYVDYH